METGRRSSLSLSAQILLFLLMALCAILPVCTNQTLTRSKFKAAVYEHAVILPDDPKKIVSREEALQLMRRNLAVYAEQAAEVKRQGADILVFPEDGLYGFSFTWLSLGPYLEKIPDPTVVDWIPCDDPNRFPDTEVQHELSCMAKNNSLYIVANMGDFQPCHPMVVASCNRQMEGIEEHFQYNTDVAFDPEGKLVARYHKQHLFFEQQFDTPEKAEFATFDTPFGRWAMFTCFDILFYEPAVTVIEREGIANIAFPTAWMDALPLLASVEFHSAFARGMGVNFLAANIHLPAHRFQGSGVYTPKGMAAFVHNATVTSQPRLILTEIDTLVKPRRESAKPVPTSTETPARSARTSSIHDSGPGHSGDEHRNVISSTENASTEAVAEADTTQDYEIAFVSELFNDLFNFVQLDKPYATLRTCSNKICCHLTYSMHQDTQSPDLFAFGAFDGLHTHEGSYYLQICALVRCANQSRHSCGSPTDQSSTSFHFLHMRGEFETGHVFPEVLLTTESNHLRLAQADEWSFSGGEIRSEEGFAYPLLAASLFGRDYSRDGIGASQSPSDDGTVGYDASSTVTASPKWRLAVVCVTVMLLITIVAF
ncbi:pantetheinase-like [Littorina saxatilis]|uniref:pantetheinase-like n=1 Tax=Littorina saxatilis TaxID=31220 RepID=UPI0038B4E869